MTTKPTLEQELQKTITRFPPTPFFQNLRFLALGFASLFVHHGGNRFFVNS